MTKFIKILIGGTLLIVITSALAFNNYISNFNNWTITKNKNTLNEISWAEFRWTNDTLNGKYFTKTSMSIPCKIDDLPYNFTFQFDLGADLTQLYENSLKSFVNLNPDLSNKIKIIKKGVFMKTSKKYYEDLTLSFGDYKAKNPTAYLRSEYGDKFDTNNITKEDTFHLGSIGADLFQKKILIIDYPNQRFAICDEVPNQFQNNLINIELDKYGRVILPFKLKQNNYKILFDNGSSLFPLITTTANRAKFSNDTIIDSIETSSWGHKHFVDSRIIKDTFELGGRKFSNVKVYENHSLYGIDYSIDGVTGNSLFWNNTIVIDFKNKRFGVN